MDNLYPPLVFLGSRVSVQFEEGLENAGDIYTAVLRRAIAVREIKGSEGELVTQLTLTLARYEGLVAHFARTKDSIIIGVTRRLA